MDPKLKHPTDSKLRGTFKSKMISTILETVVNQQKGVSSGVKGYLPAWTGNSGAISLKELVVSKTESDTKSNKLVPIDLSFLFTETSSPFETTLLSVEDANITWSDFLYEHVSMSSLKAVKK